MSSRALAYPPASVMELPGDPSKSSSMLAPAVVDEDLHPAPPPNHRDELASWIPLG
jgi:hypothetical protein